jgi:hypothetical protein
VIQPSIRAALVALQGATPAQQPNTLPILSLQETSSARVLFAIDDDGSSCILFCAGKPGSGFPVFRTDVLTCEFRSATRISIDGVDEVLPALVLRCQEAIEFGDVLAALVEETCRLFDDFAAADAWTRVAGLLTRWSDFFRKPSPMSEQMALGLWGELWTIAAAADRARILQAWRGSEGATYDFFLAGTALEVKTSTRRGVHRVSHAQLVAPEIGVLLSLEALADPGGERLLDLQERIIRTVDDTFPYYEALRRRGVEPLALARCQRRWALVGRASLYQLADVPRVLAAQPGVSDLSYRVSLDESKRLAAANEQESLRPFGIHLEPSG